MNKLELFLWRTTNYSLVQISVIVAIIQTNNIIKYVLNSTAYFESKALTIVVGKVFLRVALKQELVGPK